MLSEVVFLGVMKTVSGDGRGGVGIWLALIVLACGCADAPEEIAGPATANATVGSALGTVDSSETLNEANARLSRVARSLALALGQSEVLRGQVYAATRDSPIREGKLAFRALTSSPALGLMDALSSVAPAGETLNRAILDSLPSLELYLPVDAHRAAWQGGTNLIVAAALGDSDRIHAFDLAGDPVELLHDQAPETPTLVLIRSETNFEPSPRLAADGARGSPPALTPGGPGSLTMVISHIEDTHSPWIEGDPELYVHVMVKDSAQAYWGWARCAGDAMASGWEDYEFDQNGHNWSGVVQLADSSLIAGKQVALQVWEDDNDRCDGNNHLVPRADTTNFPPSFGSVLTHFSYILWISISTNCIYEWELPDEGEEIFLCVTGPLAAVSYWSAIHDAYVHDDFVGAPTSYFTNCFPTPSGAVRFRLIDGDGYYDGSYIDIDDNFSSRVLCEIGAGIDGDTWACTEGRYPIGEFAATVEAPGSGVSYEWYEDSVLRGTSASYTLHNTNEGTRYVSLHVTRSDDDAEDWANVVVPVYEEPPGGLYCMQEQF